MKRVAFVCFALCFAGAAHAGKLPLHQPAATVRETVKRQATLEELKTHRRFGLGFSAAGPLAIMGIEADVNVAPEFSLSLGLGTGIDYSTFMVKGRYFLLGEWVSPYIGGGIARWWTDGTKDANIGPSVLSSHFLPAGSDPTKGFNVWMVYPCVGVQFMHPMGFDFYAEAQYLVRVPAFSGGAYAGMGMHWYF